MKHPAEFVALSQKIGADTLRFPGAGGNTSIKRDGPMWIKARSELAEADLFEWNARIHRPTLSNTES
jgi:rhamnose utilization protein RhaD (predicted bifunctional aldolase and dehydrogenase)